MISRSWKVPAARSTRPLAWGDKGEYHLDAQFCHRPSELGGRPSGLVFRLVLEDGVAVGIEGEGNAAAPEQVLHQQEVVVAVFMIAKQGVDNGAGGVVHCQQQRQWWAAVTQPPVITAVQLDQYALSGHPLATHSMLGRPATARTAQPCLRQDAPQGGSADIDAFPLAQQFTQMGMVDSLVSSAGQMHHVGDHRLGCGVDRSVATVAMGEGSCTPILVSRQHASSVA